MKKRFYLLGLSIFLLPFITQAQGEPREQAVASTIDSVKLHLQGAEIFRTEELVLQPGRNHFVFANLSAKLYPQSVQVSAAADNVKILSVTSKTDFLNKTAETQRIRRLRDSTKVLRGQIDALRDEREAFAEEKSLLMQNRQLKGQDKTLAVSELKAAADFFRTRIHDINKALTRLDRELVQANRDLFDLKLMLRELNAGQEPTSEIHLVLEADRAQRTPLTLRYVVSDAGWAAIYDLESGKLDGPITLRYRALAYNNTGMDWNNVKLTLSTADPLQSATQPSLMVWNLSDFSTEQINSIAMDQTVSISANNYQQAIDIQNQINLDIKTQAAEIKAIMGKDFDGNVDYDTDLFRRLRKDKAQALQLNRAQLDVPEFNIDFPIEKPYSIPSDKKPYSIEIQSHELNVTYKYFAVPKLDRDAFLLAQIVGWEDLDLVSGPVNIYNGKKYIGQSTLDIRNLSDTLEVSLGRDKDVVVTRVKVRGKTRKQILGTQKKASVAFNISARNNHSYPIDIEIMDQVPISNDREVIITVDERAGAEYESKIGTLSWSMRLQPGETKTAEFGFSIKYPKDKVVHIQYKRSKRMEQMRYF